MTMRRVRDVAVLTALCLLLFVPTADAYIDAGSTSVIFQAVVAGLAASWMFAKLFWQRILRFVRGDDDAAADPGDSAEPDPVGDAGSEVR